MAGFTRGEYVTQHRPAALDAYGGRRRRRRAQTYRAFVPAPIADIDLNLDGPTAADLADAEAALARLAALQGSSPSLASLSRMLLRSEAVASSWIEAIEVSHRRLAEAEHGAPGERYDQARRVLGNLRAMLDASRFEVGQGITTADLLRMHDLLMQGSRDSRDRTRAGVLRREAVFIGGQDPNSAEYVGPPPETVSGLLDDLMTFINTRDDLGAVASAGLAHAQFESIHPFHDGNGRVGRCLVHAILRRAGAVTIVIPATSLVIARRGDAYVAGLNAFRRDDVAGWLSFFATCVTGAAEATVALGAEAARMQVRWRARLDDQRTDSGRRAIRSDAAAVRALLVLPSMPVFQTKDLARDLDVSVTAAQTAVDELATAGVIRTVSAGRRNRVHEVADVFTLLDAFESL